MAEYVLETSRLRLAHLDLQDAEFIVRLLNEPSFIENIGDKGVRTRADAIAYLESGPLASYKQNGFGLWRVCLKAGGAVIGMCGLIKRETLDHPDIGYAYLPEYWGTGYALEAAQGVMQYAVRYLALRHVLAIVSDGNARSIQLLLRLGFSREGCLPDQSQIHLYSYLI